MIGAGGLLGSAVARTAASAGWRPIPVFSHRTGARDILDVRESGALDRFVRLRRPGAVIYCAALADVDACESQPAASEAVNCAAPIEAARACRALDIPLVSFSTDYVFDGLRGPYDEDEPPRPVNTYGRHKARAEEAALAAHPGALVIRTSQLYGQPGEPRGFASGVLRIALQGAAFQASPDQRNSPSHIADVATGVWRLLADRASGIVHLAGPHVLSRLDAAREVLAANGLDPELCRPGQARALAPRPLACGLNITQARAAFDYRPGSIRDHLAPLTPGAPS